MTGGTREVRDAWLPAATLALGALGTVWLVRGAMLFPIEGQDLIARWTEVHVLLDGVDPNLVTGPGDPPGSVVGVYPPWSYVIAMPLHLAGSVDVARAQYALVWALCLCATLVLARRAAMPAGPALAAFAAVALFAQAAFMEDLRAGNYGTITCAMLWGACHCLENGRVRRAGLLVGLAALKPTVALPFGLALLVRRAWWPSVPWALGVPLAAAAVHWALTGVDPLTSFAAARGHDSWFVDDLGGAPQALGAVTADYSPTLQWTYSFAVIGLGASAAWRMRASGALAQFALLAPVSAIWTYHHPYDYMVLGFTTTWLCVAVARASDRCAVASAAALVAVGLTTWPPPRLLGFEDGVLWRGVVWVVVAWTIVSLAKRLAPCPIGRSHDPTIESAA